MALSEHPNLSPDAFYTLAHHPDYRDRHLELLHGKIVEVPSNPYASMIAARILTLISIYLIEYDIGHVTGEGGGYIVNGQVYAPDVAFITYEQQPELAREGFNPNPPNLAVEVIANPKSGSEQAIFRQKVGNYLTAGVIVWVINPEDQLAEVYEIARPVLLVDRASVVIGGSVLPGFERPLQRVFSGSNA